MSRLMPLKDYGQAIWLDYIRRDILLDGTLAEMIEDDGVSGLTSNPAIFQKAIGESDLYDEAIQEALAIDPELGVEALYEELAVQDIQMAANLLLPTYESTDGRDGYVSLEVSPHLARDTGRSVDEARRLWKRVDRKNLLIKIPATVEGIPAIETLLSEGININVTLMFSLAHYEAVAQAYLRALSRCPAPDRLASVASFFVSRVDSMTDAALQELDSDAARGLMGRIAIANSKVTYLRYQELFCGADFQIWRDQGVRPQRVLWASTSTKNPAYRDVIYIEELIGPETVNTVPPKTLEAFRDHGEVQSTLMEGVDAAQRDLEALRDLGIDLDEITERLQRVGVEKFVEPFDDLLATLEVRVAELSPTRMNRPATEHR
jgi:transaldolase